MKRLQWILTLLITALPLAPATLSACPACSEAIASSSKLDGEKDNTPAAFNQSIYLMIGVPYFSLGIVGFMIYRGAKKNAEYLAKVRGQPATEPSGGPK